MWRASASGLKSADLALYRAKADGRGISRYFEPQMDATTQARRVLEADLHAALAFLWGDFFHEDQDTRAAPGDCAHGISCAHDPARRRDPD